MDDYEIIFSRPSPDQVQRVKTDGIPEQFDWIALINRLANDDVTKHNEIYKLNYMECLNNLAFWCYRDKYNEKLRKAHEAQQKFNK